MNFNQLSASAYACQTFVSGVCKVNCICLRSAAMTSIGFSMSVNNACCYIRTLDSTPHLDGAAWRKVAKANGLRHYINYPAAEPVHGAPRRLALDFCYNSQLERHSVRRIRAPCLHDANCRVSFSSRKRQRVRGT